MNDNDIAYTQLLLRNQSPWWKRLLNVQAPYRWNLRRLKPGFVLDIGCGIGRNLLHLDGHGVGVDYNPTSIALCRELGLTALTPEEFLGSGYATAGRFDALLFSHVAEHMTLGEFIALLRGHTPYVKPGGRAIVITPQEAGFKSDPRAHVEFMDFEKHSEAMRQAGLSVQRAYSFPFPRWVGRFFTYNEFITVGRKPLSA